MSTPHGLFILLAATVFFREKGGEFGEVVLVLGRHLLEVAEELLSDRSSACGHRFAAEQVVDGNRERVREPLDVLKRRGAPARLEMGNGRGLKACFVAKLGLA